jgi:phosphoglycolate phosphatase-like HAD superfamily hydrolase
MSPKALIVFDMDGVIVDVRRSYRETVRRTTRLFFEAAASGHALPDPLFPLADLARIKQSGGLNNDWDLTFHVISILFPILGKSPIHAAGGDSWSRYEKTMARFDAGSLVRFLKESREPLSGLQEGGKEPETEVVKSFYQGDVGGGNVIKRIFQEVYLGRELFEAVYGISPRKYRGEGLIKQEKPMIDEKVLNKLAESNLLAIATGRPKVEALYPLEVFGLQKYFTNVLTLDDCLREEERRRRVSGKKVSLSKPHPFMIDSIASQIKDEIAGYYYIGDMPDDMLAAARSQAGYTGIGLLAAAEDRESLRRALFAAGAGYVIEDLAELPPFVVGNTAGY